MFMDATSFSPQPADLKGFGEAAIAMNEEGAKPTARPETFHMITIHLGIHCQNIKHSMYTAASSTALGNFSTVRSHWSTEFWGRDQLAARRRGAFGKQQGREAPADQSQYAVFAAAVSKKSSSRITLAFSTVQICAIGVDTVLPVALIFAE
jgi:hypothetical protein